MKDAAKILRRGGVGVLPTDTIYGIVGSALSKKSVERIYKIRRRNFKKPLIILINSIADLKNFKIKIDKNSRKILDKIWPGAVSVILPCPGEEFSYLHRGMKTLAFRLPKPQWLRCLLSKTGPLVAPSVNPEGLPSAKTIKEAKKYFGDGVDFYADTGRLDKPPSTIISIKNGKIKVIRK